MVNNKNFWGFREQKIATLEKDQYPISNLVSEVRGRIADEKISIPALILKISGLLYALFGEDYTERSIALGVSGLATIYILCAYKVAETKRVQILDILKRKRDNGLTQQYFEEQALIQKYLSKPLNPA